MIKAPSRRRRHLVRRPRRGAGGGRRPDERRAAALTNRPSGALQHHQAGRGGGDIPSPRCRRDSRGRWRSARSPTCGPPPAPLAWTPPKPCAPRAERGPVTYSARSAAPNSPPRRQRHPHRQGSTAAAPSAAATYAVRPPRLDAPPLRRLGCALAAVFSARRGANRVGTLRRDNMALLRPRRWWSRRSTAQSVLGMIPGINAGVGPQLRARPPYRLLPGCGPRRHACGSRMYAGAAGAPATLLPILLSVCDGRGPRGGVVMKGYVARKGNRWYAVVYEGVDPVTGRERRSWHPAGTERADAERLAAHLASDLQGRNDAVRGVDASAPISPAGGCPASGSCCGQHLRQLPPQH